MVVVPEGANEESKTESVVVCGGSNTGDGEKKKNVSRKFPLYVCLKRKEERDECPQRATGSETKVRCVVC